MHNALTREHPLRRLVRHSEFLMFLILVAIWIALSFINRNYATLNNLSAIMKTLSYYGLIAVGLSFVIIEGDTDMSTGAGAGFSAVFTTALMQETRCFGLLGGDLEWIGMAGCILISMAFATTFGFLNATMVVKLGMPPFIATVAMQYVLNGAKMVITNGSYIYPLPGSLIALGSAGISLGRNKIALSFLLFLGVLIAAHCVLKYTTYGRSVYATGSNRIMAQLSGIKTARVRYINYMALHALVALVGVLNAANLKQGAPNIGTDWHLVVMSACAIGGIKLSGGAGNMIGLLIGVFALFSINSAIAYIGINTFLQDVVIGLILMLIVLSDSVRSHRKVRA